MKKEFKSQEQFEHEKKKLIEESNTVEYVSKERNEELKRIMSSYSDNQKEPKHIRSSFQAKTRGDLIKGQSSVSKKLCEHLIKVIAFNGDKLCNHWLHEITTWIYDNLTGVSLKNSNMTRPYMSLFDEITFTNENWDEDQIARILKNHEEGYHLRSKMGTRKIIGQLDKLGSILSRVDKTINKEQTKELLTEWYNSIND